jgi:hypothetical protein
VDKELLKTMTSLLNSIAKESLKCVLFALKSPTDTFLRNRNEPGSSHLGTGSHSSFYQIMLNLRLTTQQQVRDMPCL